MSASVLPLWAEITIAALVLCGAAPVRKAFSPVALGPLNLIFSNLP